MSAERRIKLINERIVAAAERSGRKAEDITLVTISKAQPLEKILELRNAGISLFGESRVQDALPKIESVENASWHFIGRLQRNKFKHMAGRFELIHSLSSEKDALALARHAAHVQDVLVQVNLAGEERKDGVAPGDLDSLLEIVKSLTALRLRGFMLMPPFEEEPELNRPLFRRMRALFDGYRGGVIDTLSMGMSGDFELAIEEGATMVRIGTALFEDL